MQFLKHLLSNDGQVSSKRFAGIVAFINAIVLGYLPNTKQFVFEGFLMFSAAVLGVTIFEKIKYERSKDTRENTAATSQTEG
jgi:hypothetical protein